MNRACIVLTVAGAAVILLGFLLRSGRGAWLIAGYNTMPNANATTNGPCAGSWET